MPCSQASLPQRGRLLLSLERPLDGESARDALTLALPTVDAQIVADAAARLRCEAMAELEERTAAPERRARCALALKSRS